jgi:futalosine hydrolase
MVWIVGSAGAYVSGPLEIGDVLVSSTVFLGDEGVWEKEGFRSMEAVGIPVAKERGRALFERLVLEEDELFERLARVTPSGLYYAEHPSNQMPRVLPYAETTGMKENSGKPPPKPFHVLIGPSVTVSLSSGDEWVAKERFSRYDAWAEDMEGSAVIQVCRRFGVSVAQCRGISNRAGVRDKSLWRTQEALARCHAVVGSWLRAFHEEP